MECLEKFKKIFLKVCENFTKLWRLLKKFLEHLLEIDRFFIQFIKFKGNSGNFSEIVRKICENNLNVWGNFNEILQTINLCRISGKIVQIQVFWLICKFWEIIEEILTILSINLENIF